MHLCPASRQIRTNDRQDGIRFGFRLGYRFNSGRPEDYFQGDCVCKKNNRHALCRGHCTPKIANDERQRRAKLWVGGGGNRWLDVDALQLFKTFVFLQMNTRIFFRVGSNISDWRVPGERMQVLHFLEEQHKQNYLQQNRLAGTQTKFQICNGWEGDKRRRHGGVARIPFRRTQFQTAL